MADLTPKLSLKKPDPNVESDWGFRLNETIDTLDDAMLTTNVSGVGSITVTDDGSGNVTISGTDEVGEGKFIPNALVGSDGITVTSGDPTDDIAGFRGEFVNASGSLQTQIDTNITNIATNVSDIADNTTLITTTSGFLQTQIDVVESSDVDSINAETGEITITGTTGINTITTANTVTLNVQEDEISHDGLADFLTAEHFTEASIDHGSIGGLADDDHPQYGQLADGETAAGIWNFSNGLTVSGIPVATGTVVDEGQIVFLAQMFG